MSEFNAKWFNSRLYDRRLSQRQFALAIGVDKAAGHNIVAGKRPIRLSEVEAIAQTLNATASEVLVNAGLNLETVITDRPNQKQIVEVNSDTLELAPETATGEWGMPATYVDSYLEIDTQAARVLVVQGDSMEPTLRSGDRVLIDTSDTRPSPAGIFAIWTGLGIDIRRLSPVLNSNPVMIDVMSDNDNAPDTILAIDDLTVVGRVGWTARKM